MRTPVRLKFGLLIAVSLLTVASAPLPIEAATTNGGDFIVKCLNTGKVKAVDPIVYPGVAQTGHYHIFSANTITPSGSLTNADVENHSGTQCQDTQDTSLLWTPDFWRCAWAGAGVTPTNCAEFKRIVPTTDFRVYYIADDGQTQMNFLPDGAVFVQGNSMSKLADDTATGTDDPANGTTFPNHVLRTSAGAVISDFDCGAGGNFNTPLSPWPYNCNLVAPYCGEVQANCGFEMKPSGCGTTGVMCVKVTYKHNDWWYQKGYCAPDTFACSKGFDGLVERIFYPDCWDNATSATVNGDHLPGYIPDRFSKNPPASPVEDFVYQRSSGVCPSGHPYQVPQVSPRMHWLISDPLAGSSYTTRVIGGTPFLGLPGCGNLLSDGGQTGTKCIDTSVDSPPNIYDFSIWLGPMTGQTNYGGTTSCPTTTTPPTQGAPSCLMGLNAEHVDYWNTWQQPEECDNLAPMLTGNLQSLGEPNGGGPDCRAKVEDISGTPTRNLDDLTEDCLNAVPGSEMGDSQTCGFVSDATSAGLDGR
jgi:hypothetical protein